MIHVTHQVFKSGSSICECLFFPPFFCPSWVFIPIIRHNSFISVFYCRYYHFQNQQALSWFSYHHYISSSMNVLQLWPSTMIFFNQLCFPIRFPTSIWSTQKHPILDHAWYIGTEYFWFLRPLIVCWSAIGVYLNDYQTMSLKPIFVCRPDAICLKDLMILWECAYTVPRHLAIFFFSNLQARIIDHEWFRLES